jgi:alcohol dehydrogenase class IV
MLIKQSFQLKPVPAIHFGPGILATLPSHLSQFGRRILVVSGASFTNREKNWPRLEDEMRSRGLTLFQAQVTCEPTPSIIDALVTEFEPEHLDGVVAIGGGSVLDAGKAISAMLPNKAPITTFLEGVGTKIPDGSKIPFIAVPTTAGTGSEATSNAVITKAGVDGFKKSLRHDNYIPDLALIDPELMCSCPPNLTAACGMDTFTQLVEGYLSSNSSPMTDAIAWSGIEALRQSLVRAFRDGRDLEARSGMAYAATCSGIVLTNAGLGLIHGLAPPLGSRFGIPHGIVCATLMAPGNEMTLAKLETMEVEQSHPALKKYRKLGLLFGADPGVEEHLIRQHFIEELYRITDELKLPPLSDFGVTLDDLERIAKLSPNKYNPTALDSAEIRTLLLKKM